MAAVASCENALLDVGLIELLSSCDEGEYC